jgi:hypothetical protein
MPGLVYPSKYFGSPDEQVRELEAETRRVLGEHFLFKP